MMTDPSELLLELENVEANVSSLEDSPGLLHRYMNDSTLFIPIDLLHCGHYRVVNLELRRTTDLTKSCRFWSEGVISLAVAAFGLLGNIVSIWILSAAEMKSTAFNRLLLALAVIDCLFIAPGILIYVSKVFGWHPEWYNHLFPVFLYPFSEIALCSSMYMTVAIAVERYIGLCRPLQRLAGRPCSAKVYIVPVLALSLLLNVPKFLEAETRVVAVDPMTNSSITRIKASSLRKHPGYITYYWLWTRLLATGILPLILLAILNSKIYLAIRQSKQQLRTIAIRSALPMAILGQTVNDLCIDSTSAAAASASARKIRQKEAAAVIRSHSSSAAQMNTNYNTSADLNLAPILFGVVIVFIVCNFLRLVLNFYDFTVVDEIIACERKGVGRFPPPWIVCSVSISHTLLMVNSSVNFLVYCFAGTKFRTVLTRKLHSVWKRISGRLGRSGGTVRNPSPIGEPPDLPNAHRHLLLRDALVDPKIESRC